MIEAVILQAVLIFINAIFASAEIAVISMNETKLKHMVQEGNKKAGKISALTEQPAKFLSTIQVAITLAGLLGGAFAADHFADPLIRKLRELGVALPEQVLRSIVVLVITLILTYFSLVFGELVPKRIAMKKTEKLALGMSGLLYGVSVAFAPLVWLLTASTNLVLRLMGINPNEEEVVVTEEDIRMMLAEGNEQGTIQEEESWMIKNIFEFDDTTAGQISTHKREAVCLYMEDSEEEWAEIIGILNTKIYFRSEQKDRDFIMKQAVEKPFFVPEEMRANALFNQMKQTRHYFAVVLDEYGCMFGIVTIHDLIETLVGDLEEEKGPAEPADIEKLDENTWRIQGDTSLEDVAECFDEKLPTETYDTFSGFISELIGRIPEEGEHFVCESEHLTIEVMNVKNHIVDYALVKKKR